MNHWWRAYNEAVNDPKLQLLSDALFRAWFNVMCIASSNDGNLPPLKDIAFTLRIQPTKAAQVLAQLHTAGLLDKTETGFVPHNWNGRQYKTDNSTDRVTKYRDKRRAAGLPVLSDYSVFRPKLIARDGECCIYCRTTSKLVVDHLVPITLGGTDDLDNLGLACKPCNSGKAGRTPELAGMAIVVTSATSALARYRDKSSRVTVTETPPETEDRNREQKCSEADASGAEAPDHRKRLFGEGLSTLAKLTGKGPDACRSFVGKCLKAAGDDAVTVLGLIEDAERNQVVDPSAWIAARLKGPNANGSSGSKIIQAADDLVRKIASFDGPARGVDDLRGGEISAPVRLLSHG